MDGQNFPHYSSDSFIPMLSRESDYRLNRRGNTSDNRMLLERCCDFEAARAVWKRSPSPYTYGIIGIEYYDGLSSSAVGQQIRNNC
ncbi:hypothetical protein TNCV_3304511 [Trichonephila clavipes]|nr:hypothetical protein TNCV_3304511 [Trichonephila clavipes]